MRHRPFAPPGNDDASLADWVEACMLILDVDELSRTDIIRLLSNEPLDEEDFEPIEGVEDAGLEHLVREDSRADRLLTAIERRFQMAPAIYPFRIEADLVARAGEDDACIYLFLLWLTVPQTPFRQAGDYDFAELAFDRVAALAVRNLLGPPCLTMLFSRKYADDASDDVTVRPVSFPDAIKRVRQLMLTGGKEMPPDDPDGAIALEAELPSRTYQDGGVDVLAWRSFRDERPAFPVMLAQCTIQTKWRGKTRDVVPELWNSWVTFPTPFQRALVIPWAVSHESKWRDRNLMAGLILDRMRVSELLDSTPADAEELCDEHLLAWLREQVQGYTPEEAAA